MRCLLLIACSVLLVPATRSQGSATAGAGWTSLFESYVAWDERGRGRPQPWEDAVFPGPAEIEGLVREPPRDPRQAFGLALFLLSNHRDAEAHRLIERIGSSPTAPARARTLRGCLLVTEGRFREALAQWDAAEIDETCGRTVLVHDPIPVRFMKAIALHAEGRADEARRLLADAGDRATASATCLLGDLHERDGHPAAALATWQGGACEERLAEHRAGTEPFEVLRASWGGSGESTRPSAIVAAARLGAIDLAREGLEQLEAQCEQSVAWTPDCLRLPVLRRHLGDLSTAGSPRVVASLAPFTVRSASSNRLPPHDPDSEEIGWMDDPPDELADWDVVRFEQDANLAVAVSAGRAPKIGRSPDPFPLYRLHVSRDGGAHYDEPIVLGLVPGCPAVVRPQSRSALLSGSTVQLEVLRPRSRREPEQLEPALLVAPLQALTRDGDGDGLTDALEHAWRLDPSRADTDGDGEPDGSDASPRVPPGWRRPELDGFLEFLASDSLQSAMGVQAKDLPARASPATAGLAAPERQEPMQVILLRPQASAGDGHPGATTKENGPRLIALSRTEADACGDATWGMTPGPAFVRLDVVFDLDGSRALVRQRGPDGGSAWLAQGGAAWTRHPIVMWVH